MTASHHAILRLLVGSTLLVSAACASDDPPGPGDVGDDGGDGSDGGDDAGGGGGGGEPPAEPREVITETVTLQPGELIEGLFNGTPEDSAVIQLSAAVAEIDWNIHGHDGDETQTVYEELNRSEVEYHFVPPAATEWWLLLRNSGAADLEIAVEIELYGELTMVWE